MKMKTCQKCKGTGRYSEAVMNHGTKTMEMGIHSCEECTNGIITESDRQRYYHSLGVGPCQSCKK